MQAIKVNAPWDAARGSQTQRDLIEPAHIREAVQTYLMYGPHEGCTKFQAWLLGKHCPCGLNINFNRK